MDNSVLKVLEGKAVYLSAIGGAAILYAKGMRVKNIYKQEFGMPEAIWELEVRELPLIVTMDSRGNSLHERIYQESKHSFMKLIR